MEHMSKRFDYVGYYYTFGARKCQKILVFTTLNNEILGVFVPLHVRCFWQNLQHFEGWTTGFADAAEDVLEDMKIPSPPHSEICAKYTREKFENDSH